MRRILVLLLLISFLPQAGQVRAATISYSAPETTSVDDDPTPSPTPTPTPDAELEEKKRAAALAEEEKKRAVAEQAAAEARLAKLKAETAPLGDITKVTVPTGSVQTDEGGFVEVEMLSQEAAREIADQVTKSLCDAKFPTPKKDSAGRDFHDPNWTPNFDTANKTALNTLVIYDSSEVAALELYSSMVKQLARFDDDFDAKETETSALLLKTNLEGPPAMDLGPLGAIAIPGVATGIIKSVAELINLFRTDTEFKNKKVTIPEDMVVSYLINYVNGGKCTATPLLYYPHLYPPNLESDQSDSALLKLLTNLGKRKGTAAENIKKITKRIDDIKALVANLKLVDETPGEIAKKEEAKKKCRNKKCIEDLDKEIDDLKDAMKEANDNIDKLTNSNRQYFVKEILAKKVHEQWLSDLNKLKALTQFLIDSADLVTTKLNTPDDATKLTAVAQLLRAERLRQILRDPLAFTLRIAVTANGTTKIKKNLFVDAKVRHTAGANLVYQLFDHDGRVVMGEARQFYFDYMSATEVKTKVCTANSNCPPPKKGK